MSFYNLTYKTPSGEEKSMVEFENKAVLIVNTATQCGLTPQFEGLEKLHNEFKDKDLVVLGFPCNQFGSQEPLTNETMIETCQINHGVTFQLTEKVNVNGPDAHPVFKYLKKELKGTLGNSIKWNFTKFLITPEGKPFKRYAPTTKPDKIRKDIAKLLED